MDLFYNADDWLQGAHLFVFIEHNLVICPPLAAMSIQAAQRQALPQQLAA